MRTLMLLLMLVTLGGTARAVETVEQTPLMRLRRIGNLEVLSGKLQVVHYGKETFLNCRLCIMEKRHFGSHLFPPHTLARRHLESQ